MVGLPRRLLEYPPGIRTNVAMKQRLDAATRFTFYFTSRSEHTSAPTRLTGLRAKHARLIAFTFFCSPPRAFQTPYGHATRRPPPAQHLPNAVLTDQASCAPQSSQAAGVRRDRLYGRRMQPGLTGHPVSSTAPAEGGAQFDKKRRQSDSDKKCVVAATDAVTSIDTFPASMASERWWFASLAWAVPSGGAPTFGARPTNTG